MRFRQARVFYHSATTTSTKGFITYIRVSASAAKILAANVFITGIFFIDIYCQKTDPSLKPSSSLLFFPLPTSPPPSFNSPQLGSTHPQKDTRIPKPFRQMLGYRVQTGHDRLSPNLISTITHEKSKDSVIPLATGRKNCVRFRGKACKPLGGIHRSPMQHIIHFSVVLCVCVCV